MTADEIAEIGIDEAGSLYVRPSAAKFPLIYREAMEVSWDRDRMRLFSPKPREWSYLDWFKQIRAAASEQGVALQVTPLTIWSNVPLELQRSILVAQRSPG